MSYPGYTYYNRAQPSWQPGTLPEGPSTGGGGALHLTTGSPCSSNWANGPRPHVDLGLNSSRYAAHALSGQCPDGTDSSIDARPGGAVRQERLRAPLVDITRGSTRSLCPTQIRRATDLTGDTSIAPPLALQNWDGHASHRSTERLTADSQQLDADSGRKRGPTALAGEVSSTIEERAGTRRKYCHETISPVGGAAGNRQLSALRPPANHGATTANYGPSSLPPRTHGPPSPERGNGAPLHAERNGEERSGRIVGTPSGELRDEQGGVDGGEAADEGMGGLGGKKYNGSFKLILLTLLKEKMQGADGGSGDWRYKTTPDAWPELDALAKKARGIWLNQGEEKMTDFGGTAGITLMPTKSTFVNFLSSNKNAYFKWKAQPAEKKGRDTATNNMWKAATPTMEAIMRIDSSKTTDDAKAAKAAATDVGAKERERNEKLRADRAAKAGDVGELLEGLQTASRRMNGPRQAQVEMAQRAEERSVEAMARGNRAVEREIQAHDDNRKDAADRKAEAAETKKLLIADMEDRKAHRRKSTEQSARMLDCLMTEYPALAVGHALPWSDYDDVWGSMATTVPDDQKEAVEAQSTSIGSLVDDARDKDFAAALVELGEGSISRRSARIVTKHIHGSVYVRRGSVE